MARKTNNQNQWFDDCNRDGDRLVKELRRQSRTRGIPMTETQNGSHRKAKFSATQDTRAGSLVVPMGKEQIQKGTWGSIERTLKLIGILMALTLVLSILVIF